MGTGSKIPKYLEMCAAMADVWSKKINFKIYFWAPVVLESDKDMKDTLIT